MVIGLSIILIITSLVMVLLVLLHKGEAAPGAWVWFGCANKPESGPSFATDAATPDTWEGPRCANPAGQNEQAPPNPPRVEPYKTHLAYVKERRSDTDGEAILAEALARLRGA